ncbi:Transposase IS4 [Phytophthora infestans]|uniref:Transposase IS4 n=1 Tax=Phytophthora infestans TaxID=4787 RepID=A0A8S9U0U3_PHYIN|nr:Transposase IS4 [Phytophthora infestans]
MDIELLLSEWEPEGNDRHGSQGNENDSEEESKGDDAECVGRDDGAVGGTMIGPRVDPDILRVGQRYIDGLEAEGGITLLQEEKAMRAFREKGILGLFALFFTRKLRSTLLQWINPRLRENGTPDITLRELNAYIGLEIATSLCPLNRLRDYWSTNELYGHPLFQSTMQRDLFLGIRAAITLHPTDTVPEEVKQRDPLWHCRSILNNILKKCALLAVPNGVSALDESSIRTKARSAARTFIPSKPDKYAVRFYALVDWKTLYVHGLFDNGSGNTTVEGHLERYTAIFPEMRRPIAGRCAEGGLNSKKATALWVAMLARQNQQLPAPSGKRVVVMDSYYTRHGLAKPILEMTTGETRVIGTCRLNYVDSLSRSSVEAAVLALQHAERGSWKLVAAMEAVGDVKAAEKEHKRREKGLKKAQKTPFVPPQQRSANAGYIVFRDKRVVIFYTNDLTATPSINVQDGSSREAQMCCNGMGFIKRWTGTEVFRRSKVCAPAIVCAYNKYMNAVDRFDQLRSTNPTRRREKRLQMSIFTWLLDVAIHNAYAIYQAIIAAANGHAATDNANDHEVEVSAPKSLREAKEEIVNLLVAAQHMHMQSLRHRANHREPIEDIVGSDQSQHMLTRSRGKLLCLLCSIRGGKNRVKYACTRCRRGYHVECFMAIHYKHMMSENAAVMNALSAVILTTSGMPISKTRHRQNTSIIEPCDLELPKLVIREPASGIRKRRRISPAV